MPTALQALPVVARGPSDLGHCVESATLPGGSLAQVVRWRCRHDGEALRAERHHTAYVLTIVGAGACTVRDGGRETTLDPATAVLHRPGAAYRTAHPFGMIDRGWSIAYRRDAAEEIFDRRHVRPSAWSRPSMPLGSSAFPLPARELSALYADRPDPLALQEMALELLDRVARELRPSNRARREATTRAHRRTVAATVERLNLGFDLPLDLDALARQVGASPAHLCRLFKRHTGTSIRAYLHRVRLGNALQRVADGERSLAAIALDTGFCSHSHFTTTCTRILGGPPDTVRAPTALRRAG